MDVVLYTDASPPRSVNAWLDRYHRARDQGRLSGARQTGAGTAFLDIDGCPREEIPLAIEVPTDLGRFHPGEATAQVLWFACNDFECANKVIDREVTIGMK